MLSHHTYQEVSPKRFRAGLIQVEAVGVEKRGRVQDRRHGRLTRPCTWMKGGRVDDEEWRFAAREARCLGTPLT